MLLFKYRQSKYCVNLFILPRRITLFQTSLCLYCVASILLLLSILVTINSFLVNNSMNSWYDRSCNKGNSSKVTNKWRHSTHLSVCPLEILNEHVNCDTKFDCSELLKNNEAEVARATYVEKLFANNWMPICEKYITNFVGNCNCKTITRLYMSTASSVTDEEKNFPLAFTLIVYKEMFQIAMLLQTIYRPHNFYCIHVDKKSSKTFKQSISKLASCFSNVLITSQSFDVRWGTISVLQADIACFRQLLEHSTEWKYVINLTGFDFPLKTNLEMVSILTAFNGSNNIEGVLAR